MSIVYIDSCTFVIAFEMRDSTMTNTARRLIETLRTKPGNAATSELTIAELLAPAKDTQVMSSAKRRRVYLRVLDDGFIKLTPVSRAILEATVTLRETYPQRIPDAIQIATAVHLGSRFFVSFDRDARRRPPGLTWIAPTDAAVDKVLAALDA